MGAGVATKIASVARVVDGDTVRLVVGGREESARVIGINTPETVDPRRDVQCYGREATRHAQHLLPQGTTVQVAADPTQDTRDRFGRLLLHVWLADGRSFAETMIREGYGHEYTYQSPYRGQDAHRAAQREAEAARRGLWAPDACSAAAPPTPPPPKPDPAQIVAATPTPILRPEVVFISVVGGRPGGRASAEIRTTPSGSCTIRYTTPAGTVSSAQGLTPKSANAVGIVSWSWVIGSNTRAGFGTVVVTCAGQSATARITVG